MLEECNSLKLTFKSFPLPPTASYLHRLVFFGLGFLAFASAGLFGCVGCCGWIWQWSGGRGCCWSCCGRPFVLWWGWDGGWWGVVSGRWHARWSCLAVRIDVRAIRQQITTTSRIVDIHCRDLEGLCWWGSKGGKGHCLFRSARKGCFSVWQSAGMD